jgi:hypothetical protein
MAIDKFPPFASVLKGAIGSELDIVTFIRDYWPITFNNYSFSVLSSLRVTGNGWSVRDKEAGFRDRLCNCIGHKVEQASHCEDCITFSLDNGCSIEISLRDEDYQGPEAVNFKDPVTGLFYVF